MVLLLSFMKKGRGNSILKLFINGDIVNDKNALFAISGSKTCYGEVSSTEISPDDR